jgi:hypothetical protein
MRYFKYEFINKDNLQFKCRFCKIGLSQTFNSKRKLKNMKKQRKFVKVQRVVYEISQARNVDVYV